MVHAQTLRRLALFTEIAKAGSLRAASRNLRLSTPVLSTALSELEAELQTTLINRTTRKMALTPKGETVLRHAEAMLESAAGAVRTAASSTVLSGSLSLTVPSELATSWLPKHIRAFQSAHPSVRLRMDVNDETSDMKTGDYEIALRTLFNPPGRPSKRVLLPGNTIVSIPLLLVARPPVPEAITANGRTSLAFLGTMATGESVSIRARHRTSGTIRQIRMETGFSVSSRETACKLAEEGFGAALLMEPTVAGQLAKGTLARVLNDHDFGSVQVQLIYRDNFPTPEGLAFAEVLRSGNTQAPETGE